MSRVSLKVISEWGSLGMTSVVLTALLSVMAVMGIAKASDLDPICSKYVESRGFQKFYKDRTGTRVAGDTIYWETRVLPDFERIARDPKFANEAIANSKFKSMLASYGLRENEISQANQDRVISDCRKFPELEGCLAMQTHCVLDYVRTQYPRAIDAFNGCAEGYNRNNGCGAEFQTADGIKKNVSVLRKFAGSFANTEAELAKKPNMTEYVRDIQSTFQDFSARVQASIAKGESRIEELKKQEVAAADLRYKNAEKEASSLGNACRAFKECNDYLSRKGYDDGNNKNLLNQISSCEVMEASTETEKYINSKQFDSAMENMKAIRSAAGRAAMAGLARDTFKESYTSSAKQYLTALYRINGSLPSESEFTRKFGKPGDVELKGVYAGVKSNLGNAGRIDIHAEIAAFNTKVEAVNKACADVKDRKGSTEALSAAYSELVYKTTFGNLLTIDKFSEKVGKYNEKGCYSEGGAMKTLDPKSDFSKIKESLNESAEIIAEKGKALAEQERDFTNEMDPGPGIRYFLEYEPLVLREMIRRSNSPEQAMLLCQAIEKIYSKEENRKTWSKVFMGVAIAGAIAATVLTGGAAAPVLFTIAGAGITSTALIAGGAALVGVGNSLYTIKESKEAEERYDQANAAGTYDRGLAQSFYEQNRVQANTEMATLPLQFIPVIGKGLGGVVSRTAAKSMQALAKTRPAWREAISAGAQTATQVAKPITVFFNAAEKGRATVGELVAALAAKVGPKTSQVTLATFNSITMGMGKDAAMIFGTMALTHPDPYSEQGMKDLLVAFVQSRGIAALGGAGGKLYAELKKTGKISTLSNLNASEKFASSSPKKSNLKGQNDSGEEPGVQPKSGTSNHTKNPKNSPENPEIFLQGKSVPLTPIETTVYLDRKKAAQLVLGMKEGEHLTPVKAQAVYEAHLVGDKTHGYGTYTKPQLREKTEILLKGGFTEKEASLLLHQGVAGGAAPVPLLPAEAAKLYQKPKYTEADLKTMASGPMDKVHEELARIKESLIAFKSCDSYQCKKAYAAATEDYRDLRTAASQKQPSSEAKAEFLKQVPSVEQIDFSKAVSIATEKPVDQVPVAKFDAGTKPVETPPNIHSNTTSNLGPVPVIDPKNAYKYIDAQKNYNSPKEFVEIHKQLPEVQAAAVKVKATDKIEHIEAVQSEIKTELGKISESKTKLGKSVQVFDALTPMEKTMSPKDQAALADVRPTADARRKLLADLEAKEASLLAEQKRIAGFQSDLNKTVLKDPAIYIHSLGPDRSGALVQALETTAPTSTSLSVDQTERLLQSIEHSIKSGKYKFSYLNEADRADAAIFKIATSNSEVDIRYFPEVKARIEKMNTGVEWVPPLKTKYVEPAVEEKQFRVKTEKLLGRPLSDQEAKIVYDAETVGRFELGKDGKTQATSKNLTDAQIKEKKKLLQSIFPPKELKVLSP